MASKGFRRCWGAIAGEKAPPAMKRWRLSAGVKAPAMKHWRLSACETAPVPKHRRRLSAGVNVHVRETGC